MANLTRISASLHPSARAPSLHLQSFELPENRHIAMCPQFSTLSILRCFKMLVNTFGFHNTERERHSWMNRSSLQQVLHGRHRTVGRTKQWLRVRQLAGWTIPATPHPKKADARPRRPSGTGVRRSSHTGGQARGERSFNCQRTAQLNSRRASRRQLSSHGSEAPRPANRSIPWKGATPAFRGRTPASRGEGPACRGRGSPPPRERDVHGPWRASRGGRPPRTLHPPAAPPRPPARPGRSLTS
jgi:hypothetical protein